MINRAISLAIEGKALPAELCAKSLKEIISGNTTEAQIASLLTALSMKGASVEEITAFAKFLKNSCNRIAPKVSGTLIDICGTGGDNIKTFNVSTAAAFVIAAAGVPVAKHGNRAFTSKCGSADILEALGVNINLQPKDVKQIIEKIGIGFMFAPNFHPSMKNVAKVRKELGIRTIFNLIGPLANPANVQAQVVGVYSKDLVAKFAHVLKNLGLKKALVVHGSGMDEISTIGETLVAELKAGKIIEYVIKPDDFQIKRPQLKDLQLTATEGAAQIFLDAITGNDKAKSDIVCLNAAAGIFIGGKSNSLKDGFEIARSVIQSGKAFEKLEKFIEVSQNYGN